MVVAQPKVRGEPAVVQAVLDVGAGVGPRALAVEDEELASPGQVVGSEVGVVVVGVGIVESRVGEAEGEGLLDREALHHPAHLHVVMARGPVEGGVRTVVVQGAVGDRSDGRVVRGR